MSTPAPHNHPQIPGLCQAPSSYGPELGQPACRRPATWLRAEPEGSKWLTWGHAASTQRNTDSKPDPPDSETHAPHRGFPLLPHTMSAREREESQGPHCVRGEDAPAHGLFTVHTFQLRVRETPGLRALGVRATLAVDSTRSSSPGAGSWGAPFPAAADPQTVSRLGEARRLPGSCGQAGGP